MATRTREHLSPESWTPNPCRYFYTLNTTPYLETVTLWWSLWWSTGPTKGNCRRRPFLKFHNHVEMELDVIKTFRSGSMLLQYCRLQKMLQDDKPRYTWCKLAHRIFLLSTGTWSHSGISCRDTKVGCSISIPSDDSRIRISALTAIASRIRSRVIYVPDLFAIRTGKEGVVSCPVLPVGTREVGTRLLPAGCEHRIASVPFERPNGIRRSPAV